MSTRIRRLSAVAAFAFALTCSPMTSLAYPLSTPVNAYASPTTVDVSPQPSVSEVNPVRALLNLVAQDSAALWSALDGVYSDNYVETACDPSC